jgi:rubrerythrin
MTDQTPRNELNARLDRLIQLLIDADQRGSGIEPLKIAKELGEIKVQLARRKTIRPRPGGQQHWRCEVCGTVTHADARPSLCPECGAKDLWEADLKQPNVESGAG